MLGGGGVEELGKIYKNNLHKITTVINEATYNSTCHVTVR